MICRTKHTVLINHLGLSGPHSCHQLLHSARSVLWNDYTAQLLPLKGMLRAIRMPKAYCIVMSTSGYNNWAAAVKARHCNCKFSNTPGWLWSR
jgi:hypothetical protein